MKLVASNVQDSLENERRAFNEKIRTKMHNGFIPDIRRMETNTYFIKQFWREPYFVNLHLGHVIGRYNNFLLKYVGPGSRLLDVGCGAGYISLELARLGFHVTAIDIADEAIASARDTLTSADKGENFGSLEYRAVPFAVDRFLQDAPFDVILFSASLHHFPDIDDAVRSALQLCRSGGILIAYEPATEMWTEKDAAVLAFVRCALAITGNWYDPTLAFAARSEQEFHDATVAVLAECTENKDELTPEGQSDNDDGFAGRKIHDALSKHAELLECEPATAYLHTGFGGLRANDQETLHRLGDLLATFERYALHHKVLRPTAEFFVARKTANS